MITNPLHSILAMRLGPAEFGQPAWLWALLLLVPIIYFWKTSQVPASVLRRWVSLILRLVLVLALVLSLADLPRTWFNKGICVAFVLDQSQSVPGPARENVRALIAAEVQKMSKEDQFAVIEFGGDAVVGALPSAKGDLPAPAKVADTGHTDIARALRLAMASFPADHQQRIVLFSDGNQNEEDALREARIAGVIDIDIDVLPIIAQRGHEVMVDQVIVPSQVRKDARFLIRTLITSDIPQNVDLIISRDGSVYKTISAQPLNAGSNVIDVPDALSDGGTHEYSVTVVPEDPANDTFAANNTGDALTRADAPGRVLLVEGKSSGENYLYDSLIASGVQVSKTTPAGLPGTTGDLAQYDCVILNNVNRFDIDNSPQMPALKKWVEDFGGGLVLVGGDDSFGPGGYKGTLLEDLSPVSMDVKREKHLASLAVVVICDKSGSMGMEIDSKTTKMDLCNEGACEVAKMLNEGDIAALGVCDTEVRWAGDENKLIPMTPGNKARLSADIRTVRAGGGGIYCETALEESYKIINAPSVQAMTKHVIMFADSQDSEQQDNCVEMAKLNYNRNAVTTSVIGMGTPSDPDVPFQQEVAKEGHGRWFIADDVHNLPRLFVKDAFMVSRQAYVEDVKGIALTPYSSPLLEGFINNGQASLPKVYGYVGTTLKPRATLALHGKEADDPVLAHWSIGLGKCVAYTSDSSSRWGKDWVDWNGYSKFWTQIIRWVSRTGSSTGLATMTQIQGSDGSVTVDAADPTGKPTNNLQLQANVVSPDAGAAPAQLPLEQIAPGRYQGHFPARDRGAYLVTVSQGNDADRQIVATGGGVLSYPPEYRDLAPNLALLDNLADVSDGHTLSDLKNVITPKSALVTTFWPLWKILLGIVTGVLLADIAWRRLNLADWFRRTARVPVLARTEASLDAFRTVKTGRARSRLPAQHAPPARRSPRRRTGQRSSAIGHRPARKRPASH